MAKTKKTYLEKLHNNPNLPKVVEVGQKMAGKWGTTKPTDTMLIPSPLEVDEVMRKIPYGKLITTTQIRKYLCKKHKTTIACPLTTGIFTSIAAYAAEELKNKNQQYTPYWRTIKEKGEINSKYPGGPEYQKNLLEQEGHKIIIKNKKYFVDDYEKHIFNIN